MADEPGFAAPAFNPEAALLRLKRELRDMGLAARAGVFERRGLAIARAAVDGTHIAAAMVQRPSRASPQWRARTLKNSADVREFAVTLKQALQQWGDRDD